MVPRSQKPAQTASSSFAPQQGRKRKGDARVRLPFRLPPATLAVSVAKVVVPGNSPPDGVSHPLRVGGCLSAHWRHWQTIGAESWVLSVLWDGYHIPFLDSPPLACTLISFPTYRSESTRSLVLGQEIEKMLAKDALEIVLDPGRNFYSRLFLVEKAMGGWRPVIDLSHLNGVVLQTPFKMESIASVLLSIREGDFLASIDLKDAYFQIPVRQSSRKLLKFLSGGCSLPVQGPVLRTVSCPSGLHQGVCSSLCIGSLPRDSSSQVPGRLACPRLLGGHGQKERPGSALALSLLRDSDKRGETRSRSLADCKLPRYDHRYRGRQDFSCPGAGREISIGGGEILYFVCSPCSALGVAFGAPGFTGKVGSSQSSLNALPAVAFEDALVS